MRHSPAPDTGQSGIVRYIPIGEIEAWIQQGWQVHPLSDSPHAAYSFLAHWPYDPTETGRAA